MNENMSIDAMKQALEALETCGESEDYDGDMHCYYNDDKVYAAITALRLALEQAEKQEPVCDKDPQGCWNVRCQLGKFCKNAAPPQQEKQEPVAWVRWDDEENYYDVRRTPPSQEAIDYLAKWNRPAWVPAYPHPPQRQPLTDEEIWKFWWDRPEVPEGEDDSMEAEFVSACRRVLAAAHGIGGGE